MLIFATVAAVAGALVPHPSATTALDLAVRDEWGATLASATLTCQPPGGTHPRARHACAKLTAADGDPAELTPSHGMCTMIYQPVHGSITGTWRGRVVNFHQDYGNRCEANVATGGVLDF